MTSTACQYCDFIYIGDEPPEDVCPGCGERWPATAADQLDEQVPRAAPSADPSTSDRQGLSLLSFLAGAACAMAGAWTIWQTRPEPAPPEVTRSQEYLSVAGRLQLVEQERDALQQAVREAQRQQAHAEQQRQHSVDEVVALRKRINGLEQINAESHQQLTAANAALAELRAEHALLAVELSMLQSNPRSHYVTQWQLLGPIDEEQAALVESLQGGEIDLEKPYPDRKGRTWSSHRAEDPHVRLGRIFKTGDKKSAYLLTWIYSDRTQKRIFRIGSDDGVAVWLNRRVVHENRGLRSASPGQDRVKVELQEGWNELIANVDNSGGNEWAFILEFYDEQDKEPVEHYAIHTTPPGLKPKEAN